MARVLVVEDDKFLGTAYQAVLTKAGFEFKLATDGEEALTILKDWKPQVILLDLIMPRKDGFTTLEELKQNPELASIPVIVTSNLGQKADQDRAMTMGAVGFIIKSNSSPNEIIERVNSVISG